MNRITFGELLKELNAEDMGRFFNGGAFILKSLKTGRRRVFLWEGSGANTIRGRYVTNKLQLREAVIPLAEAAQRLTPLNPEDFGANIQGGAVWAIMPNTRGGQKVLNLRNMTCRFFGRGEDTHMNILFGRHLNLYREDLPTATQLLQELAEKKRAGVYLGSKIIVHSPAATAGGVNDGKFQILWATSEVVAGTCTAADPFTARISPSVGYLRDELMRNGFAKVTLDEKQEVKVMRKPKPVKVPALGGGLRLGGLGAAPRQADQEWQAFVDDPAQLQGRPGEAAGGF